MDLSMRNFILPLPFVRTLACIAAWPRGFRVVICSFLPILCNFARSPRRLDAMQTPNPIEGIPAQGYKETHQGNTDDRGTNDKKSVHFFASFFGSACGQSGPAPAFMAFFARCASFHSTMASACVHV
jgi:hypothetical protein